MLVDERRCDDIRLRQLGSQWNISPEDSAKLGAVKRLLNKHLVALGVTELAGNSGHRIACGLLADQT